MRDPVEVIEKNGKRAEIYYDEDAENPRKDGFCDWLGTMICGHGSYILGDEKINVSEFGSWDEVERYLIDERHARVILPLSLYDHSGITMCIGRCHGWDSGQVGFIYVSEEDCIKGYGKDYDVSKIEDVLRSEVEVYDHYLTGEVYGFKIFENQHVVNKCPHCDGIVSEGDEGVEIDSCWGFYGMDDVRQAVEEAIG